MIDNEQARLSAGEVARRLGIAPATLRTWDRRYGLGPTGRTAGNHRRYTGEDLARLAEMQRLTASGVPARQAATWASTHTDPVPTEPPPTRGRASAASRGLVRAALRADTTNLDRALATHLTTHGVLPTWTNLAVPALTAIGAKQAAHGAHIEAEHLLSAAISRALARVTRPDTTPATLLACADEEQHSLPLEALDAALAERRTAVRMLGARVPTSTLTDCIHVTAPDVVVVWSSTTATGAATQISTVSRLRPPPRLCIAAGPGWPTDGIGEHVARPATLAQAVGLITGNSPGPVSLNRASPYNNAAEQ